MATRREHASRRADRRARERATRRPNVRPDAESPLGTLGDLEAADAVASDLAEAVNALRAKALEILRRRYGDDETVIRIASEVGLGRDAVRKRLGRTTLGLRAALRRHAAGVAGLGPAGWERLLEAVAEALEATRRNVPQVRGSTQHTGPEEVQG